MNKEIKILNSKNIQTSSLTIAGGQLGGAASVLIFILLCIGIGTFMEKRKKNGKESVK
jgi:hypothetical protein